MVRRFLASSLYGIGLPGGSFAVRAFVIGGAGFIGSHLVDMLVERGPRHVYDNLSVGKREFIATHLDAGRATLVCADALDLPRLTEAMAGHDVVFHLAANPEARWGLERTRLDLEQGTIATYNALEASRLERRGALRLGVERHGLWQHRRSRAVRWTSATYRSRSTARAKIGGRGAGRLVRECFGLADTSPLRQRRRRPRNARGDPRLLQEAEGTPGIPGRARRRHAGQAIPSRHRLRCRAAARARQCSGKRANRPSTTSLRRTGRASRGSPSFASPHRRTRVAHESSSAGRRAGVAGGRPQVAR